MTRTLKEQYTIRRAKQLQERIKRADDQMLKEVRVARLLIEEIDQKDLDKISTIIQKLEVIKSAVGDEIQPLRAGIEQAQAELNKYSGGGSIASAWAKLKSKVGIDNPIIKVTTFVSALEQGFGQIPQILKNNGIDKNTLASVNANEPDQVTLADALAFSGKNEAIVVGQNSLNEKESAPTTLRNPGVKPWLNQKKPQADSDDEKLSSLTKGADKRHPSPQAKKQDTSDLPNTDIKGSGRDVEDERQQDDQQKKNAAKPKLNSVIKQIRAALAPKGIFGAFKNIPYVKADALAVALGQTRVSTLVKITKAIKSGPQTSEIAGDLQQNITGQGGAETKASTPSGEAKPTAQTSGGGQPAQSTTSSSGTTGHGETPPGNRGGGSSPEGKTKFSQALIKAGITDDSQATKILKSLVDAGIIDRSKLQ